MTQPWYCSRTGCIGMGMCCEKGDDDWVKKCMEYEVEGSRPRGRPKRTWKEVVREDCQARKLNKEDAMDRCKWRKVIKEVSWSGWVWAGECFFWYWPTRVVPDKRPLNGLLLGPELCSEVNEPQLHSLPAKPPRRAPAFKSRPDTCNTKYKLLTTYIYICIYIYTYIYICICIYIYIHTINHNRTLYTVTFLSLSETFVRRSCSILFPVLATVVMCTWQETGRMPGPVYSCPRPSSFGCALFS